MDILYDRVYSDVEKNIIQGVFQKLIFTPSISLYKMARIALENELGEDNILQHEILRAYSRFDSILSHFVINIESTSNNFKPVRKDKKYDEYLKVKQFALYDNVAKRVGFPIAEKSAMPLFDGILPLSFIKSSCGLDKDSCPNIKSKLGKCNNCSNCKKCNNRNKCVKCDQCLKYDDCNDCSISALTYDNVDVDLLAKYAPYYYHGERDGVNFIEYIVFQAIYLTKYNKELIELGKLLNDSSDTESINVWLSPVFEKIDSIEMYKTCVNTFFEIFYDYISNKYEKLADEYIRTLLLPEEYVQMKDAFKAVEKHEESQLQKIIDSGKWYDINRAFKIWDATDSAQYLIFHVMPHVWKILLDECNKTDPKQRKTKFVYEYQNFLERDSVAFYYRLIKEYIHSSLRDSKMLLRECFRKKTCS